MIRLTVMYNLPPGTDEAEFLEWRLSDHQDANAGIPGVVRTDFARIDQTWPPEQAAPYRFMTLAEWETWESFQAGFYAPDVQAKLREDVKKIADAVFLISEVMTETRNQEAE